jgi:hypothetical protein
LAGENIRWYEFRPTDIYPIDNRLGFAHREHWTGD